MNTDLLIGLLILAGFGAIYLIAQGGDDSGEGLAYELGAGAGASASDTAGDLVGGIISGIWNGSGNGPLDSWSNLENYLSGSGASPD